MTAIADTIAATASSPTVTAAGGTVVPAISVDPRRVSPIRPPASATPKSAAPTMSTRPGRRGVSQPGEAAQARARAPIPMGMLR